MQTKVRFMFKVFYNIMYVSKKLGTNYMFDKKRIFMLHPFNRLFFSHLNNVIVFKKICHG